MDTTPTTQDHGQIVTKAEADELRERIENFLKHVNQPPRVIKANQFAGGARYVPIEEMEMSLDELFVGQWETRIIPPGAKLIGNAIVYDLEIRFRHPVTGNWLTRAGSGSCKIELRAHKKDRNGNIIERGAEHALDFEKINSSALERNVPSAKAMAFRNACQSIGQMFGRDLNRDEARQYSSIYSNAKAKRQASREQS